MFFSPLRTFTKIFHLSIKTLDMRKSILLVMLIAFSILAKAQTADSIRLYNPAADAPAEIKKAVKTAAKQHKHVLLQVGGNWCKWCLIFNDLVTSDIDLSNYIAGRYVVLHINWSPENKNEAVMSSLGYPQRFGYPVFVILDDKGKRLNTISPLNVEDDKGFSKDKVMYFLKKWSPKAIDPKTYAIKPH
jgi:thioredoxin-related protein